MLSNFSPSPSLWPDLHQKQRWGCETEGAGAQAMGLRRISEGGGPQRWAGGLHEGGSQPTDNISGEAMPPVTVVTAVLPCEEGGT